MAKTWKIHYPATPEQISAQKLLWLKFLELPEGFRIPGQPAHAVYSQCCYYSNRDAQAWTQEKDRIPVQQLHLLSPHQGFKGYTLSPGLPEPPHVAESNIHSQL